MNANPLTAMGDSIKHPARRFADGGKVESAEELLKRLSGKYGVGGGAPSPDPAQTAAPAPTKQAPPSIGGAIAALKNRQQQIDQAAGYACGGKIKAHANGGKISGPGTPTSDSIPARVSETGEPIVVSNEERILSGAQDAFMEKLAQDLGFQNLDAMLEAGTGKPVGPTIKAGIKAAVDGMQPEQNPLVQMIQQPSPVSLSASPSTSNAPYKLGSSSDPHAVNPLTTRPQAEAPYQEAARNAPVQIQTTVDSLFPSVKRYANGGQIDPNRDYSIPEEQLIAAKNAIASAPAYTPPAEKPIDSARNFRETDFSMVAADPKGFEAVRKAVAPTAPTAAQAAAAIRSPVATIQPGAQERTFSAVPTAVQSNPLLSDSYRPTTSPKQTSFTEIGTKESQGNPLTTINMNANNESLARANAIREGDGSGPKVTMLGNSALTDTQNLMDKWSREDGTAAAMNQAIANPKSAGAIASLASSQMANDTNRQSSADANALTQQGRQLSADVTKRGQDINAREAAARLAGNPLANALTQVQTDVLQSDLDNKKRAAAIMEEIQDPKTTPERRKALLDSVLAPLGKTANDNRYVPHSVKTYNDMGQITGETAMMFDKQTGQYVTPNGAPASTPPLPPKDQLEAGQTYATRNGPAVWNGSEFVPANT